MKWAFKLARIANIDVYIHYTFFLLVLWFAYSGYSDQQSIVGAADGVVFVIALFACIVMHEFGHALMARRFGVRTEHITLLPFGGVASMEDIPKEPKKEILIALAGPFVNIIIAGLIYLYYQFVPMSFNQAQLESGNWPLLMQLLIVNVFLAAFNLIPAFPMDGGRVLRGLLALKLEHAKATLWASRVGKVFAALFVAYGMASGNTLLVFVGIFIFLGATGENKMVQFRSQVKTLPIINVAVQQFPYLNWQQTLFDVKQQFEQLDAKHTVLPVGNAQQLDVVLSYQELLQGLAQLAEDDYVKHTLEDLPQLLDHALSPVKSVDASMPINTVIDALSVQPYKMIAVQHENRVVGIVSIERLLQLAEL